MTRGKYGATVDKGDIRPRSHKQTIVTPLNGIPDIEISEQMIILMPDDKGVLVEQVYKELPAFSVRIDKSWLMKSFPELDENDIPTGRMLTGREALLAYRSAVRACQFERDAAQSTSSPGE